MFKSDEFGQWREWNHDISLDWHPTSEPMHAGLQRWGRDLNTTYRGEPALFERDDAPEGLEWIDCSDQERNIVSFLRRAADPTNMLLFVGNFSPVPGRNYRVGAPVGGVWTEVLNSDATMYGGSGMGNLGAAETTPFPMHDRPHSLTITLPPLAVVAFRASRGAAQLP